MLIFHGDDIGSYVGNYQHSRFCVQRGCLRGHKFLGGCIRYECQIITPMRVQNIIFIGEVFPIEVSDGLVHSLGSCQKINLYPARVLTGARVLRTLHTFRIRNDHSNVCIK